MVWIRRDFKDRLVPTPLPWARTPPTGPDCSKPYPTWLPTLSGRGQRVVFLLCLPAEWQLIFLFFFLLGICQSTFWVHTFKKAPIKFDKTKRNLIQLL